MDILNKKFRKAFDANAMVIFAAVGVIVLICLYTLSKGMLSSIGVSQGNMGSAMAEGLDKLKK